ncbi:MAG: hypothetical protein QOJ56_2904 [Mycobacterium sp.]|jgi:hypothetical protein|nr:hypothetical protein [Mycobacterium sp.]
MVAGSPPQQPTHDTHGLAARDKPLLSGMSFPYSLSSSAQDVLGLARLLTCALGAESFRVASVRDREVIDSELRLLAAVRRSIREHGGEPSSRQVDELLGWRRELTRRQLMRLLLAPKRSLSKSE